MTTKHPQLSLHQALMALQSLHAPLRLTPRSVAIWSPNKRVSSAIRTVIKAHASEIRELIRACHIDACPSPELHRQEWYFAGDWVAENARCAVCERLAYLSEPGTALDSSNFEKIKVPSLADTLQSLA